jgi:hypothetical protein
LALSLLVAAGPGSAALTGVASPNSRAPASTVETLNVAAADL